MSEFVEIATAGTTLEIHLNRADKKNAITQAMYTAMAAAIAGVQHEPGVRSILFAGHGSGFCAGNDLQDFLTSKPSAGSPVLAFLDAIATNRKVMIAALQGSCVGIGATLLLHCEHVVAAPSTVLQFNFARIGLVPEAGSSLLLPRAVGRLKAAEILLLGDPIPAADALALGLVSRVVGEGEQLETARAFARRLDALPPEALVATKQLLLSGTEALPARIAEEAAVFAVRLASPEFRDAVAAFMAKRAPDAARK
jgi:enoyl-CoA hydratase/carnithine racemase